MSIAPRQEGTVFFDPLKEKEAKRRRKYAETLQSQAASPLDTQMVSGIAVQRNPLEFLAKGVQSYMGNRAETQADEIEAQQARKRQEMLSQAISQFGTDPMAAAQGLMLDPATQDMGLKIALEEQQRQRAGNGIFSGNSIDAQMANQLAQAGYSPVDIAKMHYTRTMTLPGGGVVAIGPEARGLGEPMQTQAPSSVPLTGQTGPVIQQTAPNRATSLNPSAVGDPLADYENFITGFDGGVPQPAMSNQQQSGIKVLVPPTSQNPEGARKLSSTEQKEFYEAQDLVNTAPNLLAALDEALSLNNQAYSGATANERAWLASNWSNLFGEENPSANATVQLKNVVTGQALESLKSIFGGMPTEGERKILLEMQASTEKTPQQRADILRRARQMAERRVNSAQAKMQGIATGSIYTDAGMDAAPQNINTYSEGQIAENPQTGERLVYRNGQWVPE
jgi:hypothetical protein